MRTQRTRVWLRVFSLFGVLMLASPVFAQGADTEGGGRSSALEEIVVTAQKREQNLQDVPIAITAFDSEVIVEADIHDLTDIASRAPGLSYAEFSPGQALTAIRGITSADDGAALDNSVVVFLDDVYIGRISTVMFNLADLERIEILRGPQGTLYGKNAIGGALNVVTKKPSDDFNADISVSFGNYDANNIRALVNGPVGENLNAKLVVDYRNREGWVDNIILNKDQQDENVFTARSSWLWDGEDTSVYFGADITQERREDMGRRPIAAGTIDGPTIFADLGGSYRRVAASIDGHSDRDFWGLNLRVERDTGIGDLTAILAYRHAETDWEMASVGVPFVAGRGDVNDDIVEDIDTLQFELRWNQELSDTLRYVAGFFYLNEQTDRTEQFRLETPPDSILPDPPSCTTPGCALQTDFMDIGFDLSGQENETNSYALFGQLSWDFSEQWTLDVGGRFTFEEKEVVSRGINQGFAIISENFSGVRADDSWDDFSFRVALNYRPLEEMLLYGSVATGFKSGGFQGAPGRMVDATRVVEPEEALNFEIGMKADLLQNLRLNLTAFFTDYEDLQIVRFGPPVGCVDPDPDDDINPCFGFFTTTNAADAEIQGVELEFTWVISDGLQFAGNYAYLDAEFKNFIFGTMDLSGEPLRQAPGNSWALALSYERPLPGGATLDARLDYRYSDEQRHDVVNPLVVTEEFSLVDARLAWTSAAEDWEFALWGKNLFEEEYIAHSYTIGPGVIGIAGQPRTYGVSGTYRWR